MKQAAFLRCFLTQERVLADKTLNRENDSSVTMSGSWSTTHCPTNCKDE